MKHTQRCLSALTFEEFEKYYWNIENYRRQQQDFLNAVDTTYILFLLSCAPGVSSVVYCRPLAVFVKSQFLSCNCFFACSA